MTHFLDQLIDETDLSARAKNCLRNGGFYKLRDVAHAEAHELLRIDELGRKTLNEIDEWFFAHDVVVGERKRDAERQIRAMEERKKRLEMQLSEVTANIAHATARLAKSNG